MRVDLASARSAVSLARRSVRRSKARPRARAREARPRAEGIGQAAPLALPPPRLAVANDEAAADREPGFVGAAPCRPRRTRRSACVLGWRGAGVTMSKTICALGIEGDGAPPASGSRRSSRARRATKRLGARRDRRCPGVRPASPRITALSVAWPLPVKASEPRQRHLDARRPGHRAVSRARRERRRRLHRPDRMRRRRADADLEEFEDADHEASRAVAKSTNPAIVGSGREPPGPCVS